MEHLERRICRSIMLVTFDFLLPLWIGEKHSIPGSILISKIYRLKDLPLEPSYGELRVSLISKAYINVHLTLVFFTGATIEGMRPLPLQR